MTTSPKCVQVRPRCVQTHSSQPTTVECVRASAPLGDAPDGRTGVEPLDASKFLSRYVRPWTHRNGRADLASLACGHRGVQ